MNPECDLSIEQGVPSLDRRVPAPFLQRFLLTMGQTETPGVWVRPAAGQKASAGGHSPAADA